MKIFIERTVSSEYHDEENDERSHILNKEYVGVIKLCGDKQDYCQSMTITFLFKCLFFAICGDILHY